MAEYIEREAAMKELMNDAPEQVGYSRQDAADCIRYMDSADVAPVKHGRWVERKDDYYGLTIIKCSVCSEEWCFEVDADVVDLSYHYCPNCGARMDGEIDE